MAAQWQRARVDPHLRFVAFCTSFFLYELIRVDPSRLYHGIGLIPFPVWSAHHPFVENFLVSPGGPAEYVASYLSQFYHLAWAGALIVTTVAALLAVATDRLVVQLLGRRVPGVRYVPMLLALLSHNRLCWHLGVALQFLTVLPAATAYVRISARRTAWRLAAYLLVAGLLYYVAGGTYVIFVAVCAVRELRRARWVAGGSYLLWGAVLPYGFAHVVSGGPVLAAYSTLVRADWGGPAGIGPYLWGAFGVAIVGVTLLPRPTTDAAASLSSEPRALRAAWPWLGLLLVTGCVIGPTFDRGRHQLLRVNGRASQKQWQGVLEEAERLPRREHTDLVGYAVIRALYHLGRLPEDMFLFPQRIHCLRLSDAPDRADGRSIVETRHFEFFQLGDLLLQLGLVNDAEKEAHEALESYGPHPTVLLRLARVNIVKDRPRAARVLLRPVLADPACGRTAARLTAGLGHEQGADGDPELQRIRAMALAHDLDRAQTYVDERFTELLRTNPGNKMAFEYLMAFYLLANATTPLAESVHRLDELGYETIPRLYEEALLVHESVTGRAVELQGRSISEGTRRRFSSFLAALGCDAARLGFMRGRGGASSAKAAAMRCDFGGTYFFYYVFGESGVIP